MSSKKFNPLVKLSKGIIMFSSAVSFDKYIDGADGLNKSKKTLIVMLDFVPAGLSNTISTIVVMALALIMVYFYFSGIYRICTFNIYIKEFES